MGLNGQDGLNGTQGLPGLQGPIGPQGYKGHYALIKDYIDHKGHFALITWQRPLCIKYNIYLFPKAH